jgi:DNA polymerase-3 subunit alpha
MNYDIIFLRKNMIDFSLYLQSSYSFNGSLLDIENTVKYAKKMNYQTLGLVDRNKMHGTVKFYKSCLNHGIKPLLGLEVLVRSEKYTDMICLLYAKNNQGYENLMKLSSHLAINDGFLELHEIQDYGQGLIMVAIIDRGGLYQVIKNQNRTLIHDLLIDLEKRVEHYYLGFGNVDLFNHNDDYQYLSKDFSLVYTQPVIYLEEDDQEASEVLKRILRNDPEAQGFFEENHQSYHLPSPDILSSYLQAYPDVVKNTLKLIDLCHVSIDFKQRYLPQYPLKGMTSLEKLKELTKKGLKRRLIQKGIYQSDFARYQKRLEHEMAIISQMHYEDYFLIVWDFVLYAKKQNILVGPGRGSAAGSLISYVLGITEVDPLEFNLYFERFLNPERITMPDIDMDFPDNHRDDVIRYVVDKYGIDKVASIITFGTFQGKSAIRDVGRILDVSSVVIDDLTKKISDTNNSIESFEKEHPKDFQYYMNNPEINQLITIAKKLSGLVRHVSTHAAGVIIAHQPIQSYSPIQLGLLDMHQTQYEASDLESLGLLKIDFLGIRNLTIIADVVELIKKNEHKNINVYKLPLDDKKTFELLKEVKTLGIFQLESEGMMNLMRQMKLDHFEDIATCISLHRPGPMENIPQYIRRRNKEELVDYPHEDLIPILKPTHGIIVYQEQIMKIANQFAGYSLGEADVLRRAVSKKNKITLVKERKKFVDHAIQEGHSSALANKIYDYIVKFANYGFNKSHAVAYSYVAYWMAYLKANYPSYFLAVLLDFQIGSVSGTKKYIRECKSLGINVLPPKINHSNVNYAYEDKGLRYPYMAIKGIGEVMAERIVEIQEESKVTSFIDFYERGKHLPKNVIETLIHANVFSDFGVNKRTLIENLDRIEAFIGFHYSDDSFNYVEFKEYPYEVLEAKERELLGINFEYHIIHEYDRLIKEKSYDVLSDIIEKPLGYVQFVAVISRVKTITTKKNDEMAFITLEDEFTEVDSVLFPKQYTQYEQSIQKQKVYLIKGKTEMRHDHLQVIVDRLDLIEG